MGFPEQQGALLQTVVQGTQAPYIFCLCQLQICSLLTTGMEISCIDHYRPRSEGGAQKWAHISLGRSEPRGHKQHKEGWGMLFSSVPRRKENEPIYLHYF